MIQINTLEDRSVHDKNQWDTAIKFMESTVKDKLQTVVDGFISCCGLLPASHLAARFVHAGHIKTVSVQHSIRLMKI